MISQETLEKIMRAKIVSVLAERASGIRLTYGDKPDSKTKSYGEFLEFSREPEESYIERGIELLVNRMVNRIESEAKATGANEYQFVKMSPEFVAGPFVIYTQEELDQFLDNGILPARVMMEQIQRISRGIEASDIHETAKAILIVMLDKATLRRI